MQLRLWKGGPFLLRGDNTSANQVAHNPEHHSKMKHIDVAEHFVREKVEEGKVSLQYCPTDKMVADFLTKGVDGPKHGWCAEALGLGPKTN